MRTAYDFSPLYGSMIGVDRMADRIEASLRSAGDPAYPPYDIEKIGEDDYRITVATAGFRPGELDVTAQPNLLVVCGQKAKSDETRGFLHHGLPMRRFERRFELADYVVVRAANYANGLLTIELTREIPEAMKSRRVEIAGPAAPEPQIQDNRQRRRAA